MKQPSEAKIALCGIVRDAADGLRNNMGGVDRVLSHFCDYRVFIYENDSIDETKDLLKDWQRRHGDKFIVSLNDTDPTRTIPLPQEVKGVNPFYCRKRIEKMACARNQYLDMLDESGFVPDYVMVVDLDAAQLWAEPIMTSFSGEMEWDAVCAFGYSTSAFLKRLYHDAYALTVWDDRNEVQTEDMIFANVRKWGSLKPHDEWVRVASGFGGLAIYRFEAVQGLRYAVLPNDDPRVEVRCEHFSLCKRMIERGYDKIYLNPAMVLKYQKLSVKVIGDSLKSKLKNMLGFN